MYLQEPRSVEAVTQMLLFVAGTFVVGPSMELLELGDNPDVQMGSLFVAEDCKVAGGDSRG